MDFDQMLDAWKAQDDKPLYRVNQDLLRLVLQNEQAELRRTLRWEQWTIYIMGSVMAVLAGLSLWLLIYNSGPALYTVAAELGTTTFLAWIAAMWLSRRRQARRERRFGDSLREEIGRNLSLLDYRLSLSGRWAGMLWMVPVIVGIGLFLWFTAAINSDTDPWFSLALILVLGSTVVISSLEASRKAKQRLEPRRERLRELLKTLDASE